MVPVTVKSRISKMKRHHMSRNGSRKHFSKNASHTHVKNIRAKPMRGGIRM